MEDRRNVHQNKARYKNIWEAAWLHRTLKLYKKLVDKWELALFLDSSRLLFIFLWCVSEENGKKGKKSPQNFVVIKDRKWPF